MGRFGLPGRLVRTRPARRLFLLLSLLTVVVGLLAGSASSATSVTIVDLGTLGGTRSYANAVNDSGQVVGESTTAGDASTHAFSWTQAGGMVDLGTLASSSSAVAVNDAGQIVGYNLTADGTQGRAFSWTQAGGMVDLGTLGGSTSFALAVNGSGQVVGGSTTAAGQTHAVLWQTQVDASPPVVTPHVTGTLGSGGWYVSDVSVSWTVSDPESEVTSTSGCDPSSVTADTAGVSFTCSATSAGGTASASTGTIKRDATNPTVTYAGNAGTYGLVDMVAITCTAADNLSGVASSTCAGASGPAWAFGAGSHTLSATATDNAGNLGSATATFTVTVTPGSLGALTLQFVQSSARYQALSARQQAAVDALARTATQALVQIVPRLNAKQKEAFVCVYKLALNALVRGGWLTQSQANTLVGFAQTL